MDWRHPERAFGPGLDATILHALWRSGTHLTGAEVHRSAGCGSPRGVRYALERLATQGIVSTSVVGTSNLYELNTAHLTYPAVDAAFRALDPWQALAQRVDALVAETLPPTVTADGTLPPQVSVSVFGSVARGTADEGSDVDLLVVTLDQATDGEHLADRLEVEGQRWTGQRVQVYLTTHAQLARARDAGDPIVASFRADARRIVGPSVDDLLRPAA
jgi:predicted nucleotidyltransferase